MAKILVDDFKKNWMEQITKIEQQALEDHSITSTRLHFDKDKLVFVFRVFFCKTL
jgi:hypothetical protein